VDSFRTAPHEFPRTNSESKLKEDATNYREELSRDISACSHYDSLYSLLDAAKTVVPDEDMSEHCRQHFGLDGMTYDKVAQLVDACKARLDEMARNILLNFRARFLNIFPFALANGVCDLIDCIMQDQSPTPWRYVCASSVHESWPGADFAAPDGDEEVLIIQLKHCRPTDILRNVGFELTETYRRGSILRWQDASQLTPDQSEIKHLASKMCLKSESILFQSADDECLVFCVAGCHQRCTADGVQPSCAR